MIGVYGDSFTDPNPDDLIDSKQDRLPWALHLSQLLDQQVDCHGRSATSLWWSYQKFLATYKNYSTIVFGYTNHNRWNTINYRHYGNGEADFIGPLAHIFHADQMNHVVDKFKPLAQLLTQVHPHLYDDTFNLYVYQSIFDSVNTLCLEHNIKLINFMPFEMINSMPLQISIDKASGPCLTNIINISNSEHFSYTADNKELPRFSQVHELRSGPDRRHCHLNPHNNKILAVIIKESLDFGVVCTRLPNDPRWSYDPDHLQYLIDEL
jgi:hypothetical protein